MTFTTEPAAWIGLAKVILMAAAAFGLKFSETQLIALYGVLEAFGTVIVRQSTVTNKELNNLGLRTTVETAMSEKREADIVDRKDIADKKEIADRKENK